MEILHTTITKLNDKEGVASSNEYNDLKHSKNEIEIELVPIPHRQFTVYETLMFLATKRAVFRIHWYFVCIMAIYAYRGEVDNRGPENT